MNPERKEILSLLVPLRWFSLSCGMLVSSTFNSFQPLKAMIMTKPISHRPVAAVSVNVLSTRYPRTPTHYCIPQNNKIVHEENANLHANEDTRNDDKSEST